VDPRFVARPRPIFTCVQDAPAIANSATKTPQTACKQANDDDVVMMVMIMLLLMI